MRKVLIEVIEGAEGPCLAISRPSTGSGTRIAGPKPWGGGTTIHSFSVNVDELVDEAENLAEETP